MQKPLDFVEKLKEHSIVSIRFVTGGPTLNLALHINGTRETKSIHVPGAGSTVVLAHEIGIEDYLPVWQQCIEKASLQRYLNAKGVAVAIPGIEARIVEQFTGCIRSYSSLLDYELSFEGHAIAIAKRVVSIDPAEVLTVSIAHEQPRRQHLTKGLLCKEPVLSRGISTIQGRVIAITDPERHMLVCYVVEMRTNLTVKRRLAKDT